MRLKERISPLVMIGLAVLVASIALPLPKNGSILGIPSICAFHNVTGIPCPGCGLTRSFVCCGHGDFNQALVWHPLGPMFFAVLVAFLMASLLGWQFPRRWQVPVGVFSFGTLTLFWFLRLGGVFPLPGG